MKLSLKWLRKFLYKIQCTYNTHLHQGYEQYVHTYMEMLHATMFLLEGEEKLTLIMVKVLEYVFDDKLGRLKFNSRQVSERLGQIWHSSKVPKLWRKLYFFGVLHLALSLKDLPLKWEPKEYMKKSYLCEYMLEVTTFIFYKNLDYL